MENQNSDLNIEKERSFNESLDNSISKYNIPSFKKILVTHDGENTSNRAVNHAISISNLSGAEIVLLRVIEDTNPIEHTSVKVENTTASNDTSNSSTSTSQNQSEIGIQGPFIDEMEETIKKCREAGCSNKITYKFRTGDKIGEIVNEINSGGYHMIVLTSTNMDSWIKSLFSDTRKIMSNINIPVLFAQ